MDRYNDFSPILEEGVTVDGSVAPEPEVAPEGKKTGKRKKAPKAKAKPKSAEPEDSSLFLWKESVKRWFHSSVLRVLSGLFMLFFGAYLTVSFISFLKHCITDQSEINNVAIGMASNIGNIAGEGGARLSNFLINDCFGLGALVIVFWVFAMSAKLLGANLRFKTVNFTIKCLVALITLSLIVGLVTLAIDSPVNWGGLDGMMVNKFIISFFGWIGAALLCAFSLAIFTALCLRDVIKWLLRIKRKHDAKRRAIAELKAAEEERRRQIEELERLEREEAERILAMSVEEQQAENQEQDEPEDIEQTGTDAENVTFDPETHIDDAEFNHISSYVIEDEDDTETKSETEPSASDQPETAPADTTEPEGKELVVNVNEIAQSNNLKYPVVDGLPGSTPYKFPPFELLREGEVKVSVDQSEQLENEEQIRKTLADFGINILSIEATVGPTVTLYELVPDKGVKIAKIRTLADDIALSLKALGVRIIAPIPGRGTVGIEVPNKDPQTVSMRTIIKSKKFQESKYRLPIALGSTISNEVFVTDLTKMPHLLVAGATGQGKSVGLNAIIASLLYSKSPDELKFVMIDPKMVEFSLYAKIEQHYLAKLPGDNDPIITDMQKVTAVLSSLCVEMDDRYQLLKTAPARNIEEYNTKIKERKLNPDEGHRFLPFIVVVVDEFSDLIMTSGKEVELPIARLAQKARAVGIHVIIATQRPSTNVITGIIKANFPARMAFRVTSGVDSKTILDCTGAQQLIGRGDMLVSNNSELVRVQCAFIDTPEVEEICEYIHQQPNGRGAYLLPEPVVSGDEAGPIAGANIGERDPLFDEIARSISTSDFASTSALQRRYSIGHNRAGRIMDQLEAAGIVGPNKDGKPRPVLVDPISVEDIISRNQ